MNKHCPTCGKPLAPDAPMGLCPDCLLNAGFGTVTGGTGGEGAVQPPPSPEELAPHFPQLEILALLGRGGMGVVYKARQKALNRMVALKILAPERVRDPQFAGRFAREAQALAQLDHPHIVTVYDSGQAGGFFYLLMEFVDGANLRQLLQTRKLTPEEALAIVPPLCEALQFAHDRGIIHRDIKPENLLLDKNGQIKIADFGIAKLVAGASVVAAVCDRGSENAPAGVSDPGYNDLTEAGKIMGTPSYMAPEQTEHPDDVDSRADIYSLGVVFYEMLTGELPKEKIVPPSRKVQIDVRLDEVVLRAMEINPELRWQTAVDMRTQGETIVSDPESAPRPVSGDPAGNLPTQPGAEVNPWQPVLALLGIVISIPLFIIGFFLPFPANVFALALAPIATIVAGLKLAGLWPFPSPLFPKSNFTGRNLPRGKATPPAGWERARWLIVVRGFIMCIVGAIFGIHLHPPILGIAITSWGLIGFMLVSGKAFGFRKNPVDDRHAIRTAGRIGLVHAIGILSAGLFLALINSGLAEEWNLFLAVVFGCGISVCLLRLARLLPFPSFVAALPAEDPSAVVASAISETERQEAMRQAKAPAIGLIVTGALNWVVFTLVFIVLGLKTVAVGAMSHGTDITWAGMVVLLAFLAMFLSGFVVYAGLKMMRLECRGFALAASILAMVVSPGNLIGLPIGIWALVVLLRPEVRKAFRREGNGALWLAAGLSVLAVFLILPWLVDHKPMRQAISALPHPELLQDSTCDIQPDGIVRNKLTTEIVNETGTTLRSDHFINSDFVHIDTITDAQGRPMAFQAMPGKRDLIEYHLTFNEPVPPGSAVSYTTEGTETGLIKATGKPGVFQYSMKHWPGYDGVTRRVELHRLPPGAELIDKSPGDLKEEKVGDHIELRLDRRIPPGGHIDVRYSYRLSATPADNRDFVVFHPSAQGTAALDASREFVIGRKWRLKGEHGGNEGVTIEAADPTGKRVTFNEAPQAGDMSRFTVSAEAGSEMSATEIGAKLWQQLGWGGVKPVDAGKSSSAMTFGPVIERVVTGTIDLENGTLTELPLPQPLDERDPARYAWFGNGEDPLSWLRQRGVDVMDLGNHGLMGVDIRLAPLEKHDWQTLTPDEVREKLRSLRLDEAPSYSNFANTMGTYGFQTREGNIGILQITDTDLPRGVKIRYRLAQPANH